MMRRVARTAAVARSPVLFWPQRRLFTSEETIHFSRREERSKRRSSFASMGSPETHDVRPKFQKYELKSEDSELRARTRDAAGADTVVLDFDESLPANPGTPDTAVISGRRLWSAARFVRTHRSARHALQSCVVGEASAIRRIWKEHRVRPTCVFVPDNAPVPDWVHDEELPSVVVRCDPVTTNKALLSAEQCDGFAAEFPLPALPPLDDLIDTEESAHGLHIPRTKLSNVLVLHGVRIPSNVGTLMRAAVDFGYDAVVLDRCADMFHEKVLRASAGAPFSLKTRFFELDNKQIDSCTLLQQTASVQRLMPLFGVPSAEAEPVFSVAQRLHYGNTRAEGPSQALGSMLLLGSESQGLRELEANWQLPAKDVTIAMDNSMVSSINVAAAGVIMMRHFRPAAAKEFQECFDRGIVPEDVRDEQTDAFRGELNLLPESAQSDALPEPSENVAEAQEDPTAALHELLGMESFSDLQAQADAAAAVAECPTAVEAKAPVKKAATKKTSAKKGSTKATPKRKTLGNVKGRKARGQ